MWSAANGICAKRLVPFLPELFPTLEGHGHLVVTDEVRAQLLALSTATVDWLLRPLRQLPLGDYATSFSSNAGTPSEGVGQRPCAATQRLPLPMGLAYQTCRADGVGRLAEVQRVWGKLNGAIVPEWLWLSDTLRPE